VKKLIGPLVMLAAACSSGNTPMADSQDGVMWDSTAARDAKAAVDAMVNAFVTMDLEGVKSRLAQDGYVTSFELDLEGKPTRMATRDDAVKYTEDVIAEVKKLNATLSATVKSSDCRATAGVAYCAIDHDFSATMPDGQVVSQPSRASIALVKEGGTWKWAHWHTSLSAVPAAPGAK
jgi:hypothetical protein